MGVWICFDNLSCLSTLIYLLFSWLVVCIIVYLSTDLIITNCRDKSKYKLVFILNIYRFNCSKFYKPNLILWFENVN